MTAVNIIEFEPRYSDQVKQLLITVLQSLDLTEASEALMLGSDAAYDDSDLDQVAAFYTGRSRFWLAVVEDEVIGMAAIQEADTAAAVVRRMFVAPNYHGMGVGRRLLGTALEFAEAQGYQTARLDTHIGMKRAHAFYEKHGFQKTGEDTRQRRYALSLNTVDGESRWSL